MSRFRKSARFLTAAVLCLTVALPAAAEETTEAVGSEQSPGVPAFAGVCITGVPEDGRVMLFDRLLRAGDVLTAAQFGQMTYVSASGAWDDPAQIRYLPIYSDHVAPETSMTISLRGREDQPPVAEDALFETYKNLPSEGMLKFSDPEGQELVFTVTRLPRRGSVILRSDGSYLYTPEKNKVGTDTFTFTVTDPAGNVSREATVTIRILKPTDDLQYADTAGLDCRFEAEWLRQSGIFSGETVSGQLCFSPEESVTRGQFLAMLMETLELPVERNATEQVFLDESPLWLRPYLAAALRCGIITGYPGEGGAEFRPEQPITGTEASAMLHSALRFALPTVLAGDGTIEAWASDDETLPVGDGVLTRAEAAGLLYQVSRLKAQAPGLSFFLWG